MQSHGLNPKDTVETALRVLVAWTSWQQPLEGDLVTLHRAFPEWNHLPDDELACRVISALQPVTFAGREAVQDVA